MDHELVVRNTLNYVVFHKSTSKDLLNSFQEKRQKNV